MSVIQSFGLSVSLRVITRSWQSGPGLYLRPISSHRVSVRAYSCCVNSDYCDFLWFGLLLSPPHTQRHTQTETPYTQVHAEIQRCTLTQPHHSKHFQMRGTVVMPQAAGHPVQQMNTLQYIALHLSVRSNTRKLLVCVCTFIRDCLHNVHRYFLF